MKLRGRYQKMTKSPLLAVKVVAFDPKFTRNAKNSSECFKLIWSGTFAICSTQPLWLWSRLRSRVKKSHYIQPSNLSSALIGLLTNPETFRVLCLMLIWIGTIIRKWGCTGRMELFLFFIATWTPWYIASTYMALPYRIICRDAY